MAFGAFRAFRATMVYRLVSANLNMVSAEAYKFALFHKKY